MAFGYGPGLLASFVFSIAITYANGAYSDPAVFAVYVGTLVLLWRFAVAFREPPATTDIVMCSGLAWIGLAAMLWVAFNDENLVMYRERPWAIGRNAQLAMGLLVLTYLPWLGRRREPAFVPTVRFALFALAVLCAGVDTLKVSPTPAIDVWTVQMKGAEAFAAGKNPFVEVMVANTAPGVGGEVVPYVYPPMQVFLSWFGYRIFGDVRYTMLAAVLACGFVVRGVARTSARPLPAILEDAPALFIWLTPKLFFILEQAWTDPLLVTGIAAGLLAHLRQRPWTAAVLFGLTLATKQTMVLVVPALFILGFTWRQWIAMIAIPIATLVPYAIASPRALKLSLVDFQNTLPPRADGLTLRNWMLRTEGWDVSPTYAFVAAAVVLALALWRLRGRAAWFTATLALTFALFFALNKWAFANYYFLVAGLCALSAASSLQRSPTPKNHDIERSLS